MRHTDLLECGQRTGGLDRIWETGEEVSLL